MKTFINIVIIGFLAFITWDYAQLSQEQDIKVYPAKAIMDSSKPITNLVTPDKTYTKRKVVISTGVGVSLYQAKQTAIRNCLNTNIKHQARSKNKQLTYSTVNKVARGVVSHVNIIEDYIRQDGLHFVKLEATLSEALTADQDEKYFSQQRLRHPSIYLDTSSLKLYGDHYDKTMMKNRIIFQLEKALQDSYFELKTSPDSDYILKIDGHFNAFLNECDSSMKTLECMNIAMNVYPTMIQKNSSSQLYKSEIALEKSNIVLQLFQNKPTELFIDFIQAKTQKFVDEFVSTQLFKMNNASQIEIRSSIADFALADQLHKLLQNFYGVEQATIKMDPYAGLQLSTLVDSSFLAQSLHAKLNKLNVKITSVTRNQIFLESSTQ